MTGGPGVDPGADTLSTTTPPGPPGPPGLRAVSVGIGVLLLIVFVFIVRRVVSDWPHILDGTVPDDDISATFVANPWPTYLHIGLGAVYLFLAPLQLARGFRSRHYTLHRRLGRVLLTCGLVSGVTALVLGLTQPWGGVLEGTATAVYGTWFLLCLVLAFRAIRGGDVPHHRRWMIRAFAVSLGIGTIRIWVGLFTPFVIATKGPDPVIPDPFTFGLAFWLGLTIHVVLAEWWLRRTPDLTG